MEELWEIFVKITFIIAKLRFRWNAYKTHHRYFDREYKRKINLILILQKYGFKLLFLIFKNHDGETHSIKTVRFKNLWYYRDCNSNSIHYMTLTDDR